MPGRYPVLTENEHLARYLFAEQMVKGKRVADIACGTGYGSEMLAKAGARSVHGIDLSEEAVQFSLEHHNVPNAAFSVGNAQKLTAIPDGEYDVVVSFETIEHLPNVESYLDEMSRILRPGGTFLVSTPDRRLSSVMHPFLGHPANPHHVREYIERELLDLLSTRFEINACYGQSFIPPLLVFWPVQVTIRTFCRILGASKARDFKDNLYSNWGNVDVKPKEMRSGIPKFWVICCVRPEK